MSLKMRGGPAGHHPIGHFLASIPSATCRINGDIRIKSVHTALQIYLFIIDAIIFAAFGIKNNETSTRLHLIPRVFGTQIFPLQTTAMNVTYKYFLCICILANYCVEWGLSKNNLIGFT